MLAISGAIKVTISALKDSREILQTGRKRWRNATVVVGIAVAIVVARAVGTEGFGKIRVKY